MQNMSLQPDNLIRDSTLFDAINSGLIVLNHKGKVVIWNKWMVRYSFIDTDKALKQSFSQLFPELTKRLQTAISNALSLHLSSIISARLGQSVLPLYHNEESFQLDKRIPHSLTVTPIQMQQQYWCLIQIEDASQREEVEIALKRNVLEIETMVSKANEQEFQLQTILNNTLDSIVLLNRLGRISGFYRSAQKMFGYSEYELLGKPLSVLFPTPYNKRFDKLINGTKDDVPFSFFEQAKSLRSTGEIFHSDIAINSIFDRQDMQFIITIKDITQRQKVQDALYSEKEQAQVTLSSIADGVITTDIIGQINFINPAALKLTGYDHNELIGQRINRVITIQSDNTQLPIFQCIKKGQQVDSISGDILISKDGSQLVIHQVASPIHNQLGDIIGAVMIFRDVSKSHRLASRISWQASHDELTQLLNRREFENQLERYIESARNESSQHCLCYMDLDKFKVVNDTCGHAAGDELLRQLADIFRTKVRGADTLSRMGGDEFAIILNKCGLAPAVNIAEEIRAAVEIFRFGWDEQSFQIGISIGLVLIDAESPDQEEVFKAADSACYAAKEAGRNRVHIYSPDDAEISHRRGESRWMVRIQNALDQGRFRLYYQPIIGIDKESAGIAHYEILLRMLGEAGEIIPPGAFMSSAERYLLMPKIDFWVIENVFSWLSQHGEYSSKEIFAINLSGQTLADKSLLYQIKQLFNKYEIAARRISFEITETAAISNLSQAQMFITEFKQLGCKFALDDFGSGLSSFAYLKSLAVDYLKIDGAFVKDMVNDPIDRAMVESIHNIGSVLELKTIAEFVEDDEILIALKEVGVNFAQGYGVARPKPLPVDGSRLY